MYNLNGKKALVTGASGGIGAAIATKLHQNGATVTLSGTRVEPLIKLKEELGDNSFVSRCDLSDGDEVGNLIQTVSSQMNGLDILINNAGLTMDNLLMRMSDEQWQKVINVNLSATFKLCKDSLRGMMKSRWGRIINISSVVALTGNPGQGNYSASKAGIIALSKSLASEVASRGITVNCVAPGFIKTSMTEMLTEDQHNQILNKIPVNRMGNVEEIASGVAFLASPEASYITGTTLNINGGMAMI
ncbi:MAG: 3-oxoacyl-[acyl-carrier-protein] reductase [Paracoccaceae bacterium]